MMVALREGLPLESLKRPIHNAPVEQRVFQGAALRRKVADPAKTY
jgi:hypothetical protein